MDIERREFTRIRTRLTTFIKNVATGNVQRALTKDLGGKGLCCITEGPVPLGTKLEIELHMPDREEPILLAAEVVWSQPLGRAHKSYEPPPTETAVKFLQIDSKDRDLIVQFAALNALPSDSPDN